MCAVLAIIDTTNSNRRFRKETETPNENTFAKP